MLKRDGHRCHRDECSIPHPLKLGSSYYRDRVSEVVVAMVGQYIHFLFFFFLLYFSYLFFLLSRLFLVVFFLFFFQLLPRQNVTIEQTPWLILMQTTNTRDRWG